MSKAPGVGGAPKPSKDRDSLAYRRKNVRYKAEPGESALVQFDLAKKTFAGELAGLIVDHSYHGCCLLFLSGDARVRVGMQCRIQLGALAPMKAESRWLEEVGEDAVKVGFYFP